MKMNLDMTFEDGMKVINALRECAVKNGWDEDELDACGVIEEYSSVVDAALTAMGISVSIDNKPEVEGDNSDDEEWNEDEEDGYFNSDDDEDEEDDDSTTYSLTPKGKFVVQYMEAGYPFEEALKVANILFGEGE